MKYRIKEFDVHNDIWIIQKRLFWFIWIDQFAITGLDEARNEVNRMNALYERHGSRWYCEETMP